MMTIYTTNEDNEDGSIIPTPDGLYVVRSGVATAVADDAVERAAKTLDPCYFQEGRVGSSVAYAKFRQQQARDEVIAIIAALTRAQGGASPTSADLAPVRKDGDE